MLAVALLSLAAWTYLMFLRGGFWRERPLDAPAPPQHWPEIVAVVPARDEAEAVGSAVRSLLQQLYPGHFRVVLVDDHSSDGTAELARAAAERCGLSDRLTVVAARDLPPGWTGKLWAVSEGLHYVDRHVPTAELVLLTDADIEHHPENLAELTARLVAERLDLASLMVLLRCRSFAERALIPAFVFFFAMLYPFAWVNDRWRGTAAAAGGCMLVRRTALARIGGIAAIRGALIDDCTLGARIKEGGAIWLGLTTRTRSLRAYRGVGDIWRMIARTAYTQLQQSPILLVCAVLGLTVTYVMPPILALLETGSAAWSAAAAWLAMSVTFWPMLRLYGQPRIVAPLLPAVAVFYLAATLGSAVRHWQGRGGEWKGRVHERHGHSP